MSHRDRLIGLIVLEALIWLASIGIQAFPGAHIALGTSALGPIFALIQVALLFGPAILIGAMSRQWQGAVALNMLAVAPAFALALATPSPLAYGMTTFSFFGALAALGFFGWLLRFVRAEFSE